MRSAQQPYCWLSIFVYKTCGWGCGRCLERMSGWRWSMKKDLLIHPFKFVWSRCCCSYRVHLSSRIEHTTNKRRVNCLNTAKGMGSEKGMVVVKGKRRRVRIWTQKVAMHLWISSTTALEAEGIWIVTLTVHDHIQTQPIPISEWRGRGGDEVWVAFEWVEGA